MAKFIYDTDGMVALEKDLVTIHDEIKEEIVAIETQLEELNRSRASLEASKTAAEKSPIATVNTTGMSAEQARAAAESVAHANRVRAERIASLAREISAVDAQIVELRSVLDEITEDMELLLSVIQSVRDVVIRVDDVEAEAVSFVLRQLVNLELLSKASIKVATSVMDAVHCNSEACTGARYVESTCNGEKVRVYTDMYADLGDEAQIAYEALARVIGLNATIAVMDANGETLDLAYDVAFMVNEGVVNKEEIKSIYNANKFKVNNVAATDIFSDKYADAAELPIRKKHNVFTNDGTPIYAQGSLDGEDDTYTGKVVRMDYTSRQDVFMFTPESFQYAVVHDDFDEGGYTYIDANGMYRSAKTVGVKSDDDYYIVAMGNGFMDAAAQVDSQYKETVSYFYEHNNVIVEGCKYENIYGTTQQGYTFEVVLEDVQGNDYSIDVMMGGLKASTGTTLFPHDVPVEFFIDGFPSDKLTVGDDTNVDWGRLVGVDNTLSVSAINAYEDGARYSGEWGEVWTHTVYTDK